MTRVAVIFGAARSVGRACSIDLAKAGYDLMLTDIGRTDELVPYPLGSRVQLEHTVRLCRDHGATVAFEQCDVTEAATGEHVLQKAAARLGSVDAVVNCAGVAALSARAVHELVDAEWQHVIETNLTAAWRIIAAAGRVLAGRRDASIVNVASTAGVTGYGLSAAYVAAKHGLVGLTRAAAIDLGPLGLRVNAIAPGAVEDVPSLEGTMLTGIANSLGLSYEEYRAKMLERQVLRDGLVEPSEIASAVRWLVGPEMMHMTGAVIVIDGGYTAH